MAYKPIEEIINNIQDTVEIVKIITPVYNFKAVSENFYNPIVYFFKKEYN